jgi:hypothetical protein
MIMRLPTHIAGFRSDDPDELIEASLSCQLCLRSPVRVVVVDDGDDDASAFSQCPHCETPTEVVLTGEQALRLMLAPPVGTAVEFVV